jgi:hypothetical protein
MRVAESLSFDQYWGDPRFERKKPTFRGSVKQAYGDNIYHSVGKKWVQENSHHSYADGSPNPHNLKNDTQTNRVLVGFEYAYWGGSGPEIPAKFRRAGADLCVGRAHKSNFPAKIIQDFETWFKSLNQKGCIGLPAKWRKN